MSRCWHAPVWPAEERCRKQTGSTLIGPPGRIQQVAGVRSIAASVSYHSLLPEHRGGRIRRKTHETAPRRRPLARTEEAALGTVGQARQRRGEQEETSRVGKETRAEADSIAKLAARGRKIEDAMREEISGSNFCKRCESRERFNVCFAFVDGFEGGNERGGQRGRARPGGAAAKGLTKRQSCFRARSSGSQRSLLRFCRASLSSSYISTMCR